MRKTWKTPLGLRLYRIERWREERYQRAIKDGDYATAKRATDLYEAVSARANGMLGLVSTYSDCD